MFTGSVQLELERVATVLKVTEQVRKVGMTDGFACIVRHKVLFRDIGDVIALIVFGEQVVKGLVFRGAAIFGDRVVPFLGIRELGIDIEDHAPEGMLPVSDHLTQVVFRTSRQHHIASPSLG